MKLGKVKVLNVEFVGVEKLREADTVKKKADELEQAIQRLNEIEVELKTKK
ncbi:hypothetical protein [Streptococcus porcorum]|uniref:Uncharacterized protein n=1 Tax=Streptococcus porcorum TaxID=701526 RepID=A0ABV2JFF5_9STRE